jgi:hypothetical protein
MNNLSELIMRRPPSPEIRHQAEAWARQAYGLIEGAQETPLPRKGWFNCSSNERSREVCDQVLGVVLFNLGTLREVRVCFRSLSAQRLELSLCYMVDGRRSRNRAFVIRAEPEAVREGRDEGRGSANQASTEKSRPCRQELGVALVRLLVSKRHPLAHMTIPL